MRQLGEYVAVACLGFTVTHKGLSLEFVKIGHQSGVGSDIISIEIDARCPTHVYVVRITPLARSPNIHVVLVILQNISNVNDCGHYVSDFLLVDRHVLK